MMTWVEGLKLRGDRLIRDVDGLITLVDGLIKQVVRLIEQVDGLMEQVDALITPVTGLITQVNRLIGLDDGVTRGGCQHQSVPRSKVSPGQGGQRLAGG